MGAPLPYLALHIENLHKRTDGKTNFIVILYLTQQGVKENMETHIIS